MDENIIKIMKGNLNVEINVYVVEDLNIEIREIMKEGLAIDLDMGLKVDIREIRCINVKGGLVYTLPLSLITT